MNHILRLHIGGTQPHPNWKILNIQPGPFVDYVGSCSDLSQFANDSIHEVYASHILEHLSHQGELQTALKEIHRVLEPGGLFRVSVPDLEILCRIFLATELPLEDRFTAIKMMYGGQLDPYDFHKVGLNYDILAVFLSNAGFSSMKQVHEFDLFQDSSQTKLRGFPVSLNVEVVK